MFWEARSVLKDLMLLSWVQKVTRLCSLYSVVYHRKKQWRCWVLKQVKTQFILLIGLRILAAVLILLRNSLFHGMGMVPARCSPLILHLRGSESGPWLLNIKKLCSHVTEYKEQSEKQKWPGNLQSEPGCVSAKHSLLHTTASSPHSGVVPRG